uniref:Importin N-terminal domain-containing protein n=1 Tax=Anopheles minimus TaxID=112268 RepID=A0A182W5S3_9DIPT
MATGIQQSLSIALQELLGRFYSSQTNNEEKKAIELQLQQLQASSFNWLTCLDYMNAIENSYLWFFAATTIERTVNCMWKHLSGTERTLLRVRLLELFVNYPPDVPAMHRDKVAKIMATIARQQCISNERNYEEFVKQALDIMQHKFFLGMALVAAIGDSVTSAENTQATNFTNVVNRHTPSIVQALSKHCGMFVILVRDEKPTDSMGDEMRNKYCSQLLNIVQQYFSWMKLDQVDGTMLINITFIACSWSMLHDGAIGAVGALTELLYRNESLTQEAGRELAHGVYNIIGQETIKMSDDLYQEKVSDLVRQYIKRGWPYEQGDRSSMLHQLLEFTIHTKTPQLLMEKINIWTYVCGSRNGEDTDNEQCLVGTDLSPEFTKKLMGFLFEMLFFRTHPDLEQLDDDELDENSETELNRYLNQHIDLICQLIRFLDARMQEQAMLMLLEDHHSSPFVQGNVFFRGIIETVQGNSQLLDRYQDERVAQACMIDYITACNLLIEWGTMVYGKYPAIDYALQQTTLAQIHFFCELCDMLDHIIAMCTRMAPRNRYIYPAFARMILQLNLFMQITPSAQSIGDPAYVSRSLRDIVTHEQKLLLFTKLCGVLMQQNSAEPAVWTRVINAAIKLFNLYLSEELLGSKMTSRLIFDQLKGSVMCSKFLHLEPATRSEVYRTVCGCLLTLNDECVANMVNFSPSHALEEYIAFIASTLVKFTPDQWEHLHVEQQKQLIATLTDEMQHLNHIMSYYASQPGIMRSRLMSAMYGVIGQVLVLFRSTLAVATWATNDALSDRLLDTLLEFCNHSATLQSRLHLRLLEDIVQLLKELFVMEEKLGKHRLRSALTLLNTFQPLVNDPYSRTLVPKIIRVVIDELLPVVACYEHYTEKDESLRYEDVLNRLYDLLNDILLHHWQYFVDTTVHVRYAPKARVIIQPETFLTIMNAYGYTLLNNAEYPLVIGTVLSSLDTLHDRRSLYWLQLFTDQLLDHFMKSLLQLAVSNVGNMLMDQIIKMLHDMAVVDATKLKVTICDLNMTHDLNIFHELQSATDLPSFRMVMTKIINEAKAQPPVSKGFPF